MLKRIVPLLVTFELIKLQLLVGDAFILSDEERAIPFEPYYVGGKQ